MTLKGATRRYRCWVVGLLAFGAAILSSIQLYQSTLGLVLEHFEAGPIPVSVFRDPGQPVGQLVVVAHGFAGSRPMMQQFAVSLARNGYFAVTFDFSGHGRNRVPLTGDLQSIDGATQVLVEDITVVVEAVRKRYSDLPDLMAVVGHSMASDLVVRYAQLDDDVMATVGVAMFSPAVTATSPRNLLVINGEWEPRLNQAGYDVLAQVADGAVVAEDMTFGRFEDGTARRMVLADNSEHVAVLFSVESATAAVAWFNRVFTGSDTVEYEPRARGRWILLLIVSIVALWWALTPLLPPVSESIVRSRVTAMPTASILLIPMVATPVVLSLFDIGFLPVLVGDYLAVHLSLYGLMTIILIVYLRRFSRMQARVDDDDAEQPVPSGTVHWQKFTVAVAMLLLLSVPLAAALHWQVASFIPTIERLPLLLAVGIGTLCWFVADEWATRDCVQWRWAYPVSKVAFLLSLGIAVALDFDGLFFLLLIVPIMVPILIVFGLLSRWSYRTTQCSTVAGVSNALFLAWAIAVTFPWVGAAV